MPRVSRLFIAATLSTLAALLPVTAFADANPLIVSVVGAEYDFGHSCGGGVGTTASFAGYGSATPGGRANAFFNTTICHTDTKILAEDSFFRLVTRQRTLVGQYSGGTLTRGLPTPLGSTLCKQVIGVDAQLTGLPSGVPLGGATNIKNGSSATGTLTHFGVFNPAGGGCDAKAATITGIATLYY